MYNLNAIIKEMKGVPDERLEELYQFVHSLNPKFKSTPELKKKILSFAGIFSSLSKKDYAAFKRETKRTRKNLFNRQVDV